MKRTIYLIFVSVFLLLQQAVSFAQDEVNPDEFGGFDVTNPMDQQNGLGALLGYTKIGDQEFVGMRIQPEFNFGKIGFGVDIPLMFNLQTGKFRKDEFKDGIAWLRCVRYVRYGVKKRDPFYIRVGDLTGSYIGYGILVDNYSNSISFDKRKLGISYDILIGNMVGIEGLYSDVSAASNLFAIRPYIKPFGRTRIPIIRTMDIGATYVTDHDNTRILPNKDNTGDKDTIQNKFIKDGMNAWALDAGVMPISNAFMQLKVYVQYGNLMKNNSKLLQDSINKHVRLPGVSDADSARMVNYDASSGISVGVSLKLKAMENMFRLDARLERLWFKKYFMPQFYNASYEYGKDAKLFALTNTDGKKGIYGSLSITAMEKVMIGGSLMIPDNVSDIAPAFVTIDFDASRLFEKIVVQGEYIKGGLTNLSDALKLDERSLMSARVAYRMYKFLVVGLDYKWTWIKGIDGKFTTKNYISPYFGFQMPFNFGNQNKTSNSEDNG